MTDQTVEETKDPGSEEVQVEQTEQADQPEDGSSIKDKVEDAFDSVKDKLTGGDKDDDVDKA
jgi:hypothetical protein